MRKLAHLLLAIIISALIILVVASCSASYHLKRAKHHIAEAQSLGAKWEADTIMNMIEVKVPEFRIDTLVRLLAGDTVVRTNDSIQLKIIRLPGDVIKAECDCKPRVIVKEVPFIIHKEIKSPPEESKWKWYHVVLALLLGAGVAWIFRR
jgi:hypothetical protein